MLRRSNSLDNPKCRAKFYEHAHRRMVDMIQQFIDKHNKLPSMVSDNEAERKLGVWLEEHITCRVYDTLYYKHIKGYTSTWMCENRMCEFIDKNKDMLSKYY